MMPRVLTVIGMALLLGFCSCGDDDDSADGSSCALRTTGLSGEAPDCTNRLECGDDEWRLECEGSGTCVCLFNDAEEKTIPYEDAFCPADFSTADFDAHAEAAAAACGWP